MTEIWRAIPGFEGHYTVSSFGNVRSVKRDLILKPQKINSGYLVVRLRLPGSRKAITVHRLVALVFIPNPGNKPEVNHDDGDKTNNSVSNLFWATEKENYAHAIATGLFSQGKPVVGTPVNGGANVEYKSAADAAELLSGKRQNGTNITHCLSGRIKSACGHTWKYKNA